MSHKSACFTENVRPNIVVKALEWLMDTSDLYKNAGIKIDTSWKDNVENSDSDRIKEIIGNVQDNDDREVENFTDDFSAWAIFYGQVGGETDG